MVKEERKVRVEGVLKLEGVEKAPGFFELVDSRSGFFVLTGFLEVEVLGVPIEGLASVGVGFGIWL